MPVQRKKNGRKPARRNASPLSQNAAPVKQDKNVGRAADDVEDLINRNGGADATGAVRVLHELLAHSMLVVRELSAQRLRYSNDSGWVKQFNEACEQSAELSKQINDADPPLPPPPPPQVNTTPDPVEVKSARKVQLA